METKICTKCNIELPATNKYFHKSKMGKLGLSASCKNCKNKCGKKFRDAHPEKMKAQYQKYNRENKEKIAEDSRRYRIENPEKRKATLKLYAENNIEKNKERSKKYRENNIEKSLVREKKYREENKEKIKKCQSKYQKANAEKYRIWWQSRRTKQLSLPYTFTIEQWEQCKGHFDNICCYCGKKLPLSQEHMIALSKGGEYTNNNIIPSCQSCNSSKNDRDFFEWYPKFRHYSKKRETFILEHLQYINETQQLALTI